jgi:DNA-directed RNA polymerase subunit RPC12/RpoP
MFATATGLGSHRRNKHNIEGTTGAGKGKWQLAPGETQYKCPECDMRFDSPMGIGPHRLRAHGLGAGNKKAPKHYRCSDCGKEFKTAIALGAHRRARHFVDGTSRGALRRARLAAPPPQVVEPSPNVCTLCGFAAKNANGLAIHMGTTHKQNGALTIEPTDDQTSSRETATLTKASRNGYVQVQDDGAHRLEAIATLACGRIQQVIEGLAFTHDLPPRTLTSLIIRTLGQTSKIW